MDELLTVEEVASYLRVSRSTVYRLVNRKELLAYKIAHRWMFDREDLRAFIADKRVDVERTEEDQAYVWTARRMQEKGAPVDLTPHEGGW
jgi:excisionase family DNA binding protein